MTDFSRVLRQLRTNKTQTEQQLKKLAQAITVLEEISGEKSGVRASRQTISRRKVSKSARKKMAAAQRARWAKVRQQQKAA